MTGSRPPRGSVARVSWKGPAPRAVIEGWGQ